MNLNEHILHQAGGLQHYSGDVCRIVETQEYAATLSLVDNLEEQAELERILDDFKPTYQHGTQHRHYLISTPFRYPPLKYGSRFGSVFEPSYFYASETTDCCLAEAAFYRFVLVDGTETPFTSLIQSQHCVFFVSVDSSAAMDLTRIEDEQIQRLIRHPLSYSTTQALGQFARDKGASLLRYYSARSSNKGINVAVDNHSVIKSEPFRMLNYLCETDSLNGIVRFSAPKTFPQTFSKSQFEYEGVFPTLT